MRHQNVLLIWLAGNQAVLDIALLCCASCDRGPATTGPPYYQEQCVHGKALLGWSGPSIAQLEQSSGQLYGRFTRVAIGGGFPVMLSLSAERAP